MPINEQASYVELNNNFGPFFHIDSYTLPYNKESGPRLCGVMMVNDVINTSLRTPLLQMQEMSYMLSPRKTANPMVENIFSPSDTEYARILRTLLGGIIKSEQIVNVRNENRIALVGCPMHNLTPVMSIAFPEEKPLDEHPKLSITTSFWENRKNHLGRAPERMHLLDTNTEFRLGDSERCVFEDICARKIRTCSRLENKISVNLFNPSQKAQH
jgi:hypothetical protein